MGFFVARRTCTMSSWRSVCHMLVLCLALPGLCGLFLHRGQDMSPAERNLEDMQYGLVFEKRDPYDFGIGKRIMYRGGIKREPYGFGIGKREAYGFGIGKRHSDGFGKLNEGQTWEKRQPYNFGVGKRMESDN